MSQSLPSRGASRRPPPQVDPVELDGIRYEQARSGLPLDADDPSGWMRATEIASGNEVWLRQIYRNPAEADPGLPGGGKSVIYMKAIAVEAAGLRVTDTLGRSFFVDTSTGQSSPADTR